jgi:hypothetical protein
MNKVSTNRDDIVKLLTGISDVSPTEIQKCVHNIYASSQAFSMLIEEYESQLGESKSERQIRKLQQLRAHLDLSIKLADIVVSLL